MLHQVGGELTVFVPFQRHWFGGAGTWRLFSGTFLWLLDTCKHCRLGTAFFSDTFNRAAKSNDTLIRLQSGIGRLTDRILFGHFWRSRQDVFRFRAHDHRLSLFVQPESRGLAERLSEHASWVLDVLVRAAAKDGPERLECLVECTIKRGGVREPKWLVRCCQSVFLAENPLRVIVYDFAECTTS